jgi:phosphoserine phosphatase
MSLCGNPVAVSPEGPLRRHAEQHAWPVVDWRS